MLLNKERDRQIQCISSLIKNIYILENLRIWERAYKLHIQQIQLLPSCCSASCNLLLFVVSFLAFSLFLLQRESGRASTWFALAWLDSTRLGWACCAAAAAAPFAVLFNYAYYSAAATVHLLSPLLPPLFAAPFCGLLVMSERVSLVAVVVAEYCQRQRAALPVCCLCLCPLHLRFAGAYAPCQDCQVVSVSRRQSSTGVECGVTTLSHS